MPCLPLSERVSRTAASGLIIINSQADGLLICAGGARRRRAIQQSHGSSPCSRSSLLDGQQWPSIRSQEGGGHALPAFTAGPPWVWHRSSARPLASPQTFTRPTMCGYAWWVGIPAGVRYGGGARHLRFMLDGLEAVCAPALGGLGLGGPVYPCGTQRACARWVHRSATAGSVRQRCTAAGAAVQTASPAVVLEKQSPASAPAPT